MEWEVNAFMTMGITTTLKIKNYTTKFLVKFLVKFQTLFFCVLKK